MAQYVVFILMCALCALNVYLLVEMGNAFSAAAAVFIALVAIRQAILIAEIEGRKQ